MNVIYQQTMSIKLNAFGGCWYKKKKKMKVVGEKMRSKLFEMKNDKPRMNGHLWLNVETHGKCARIWIDSEEHSLSLKWYNKNIGFR